MLTTLEQDLKTVKANYDQANTDDGRANALAQINALEKHIDDRLENLRRDMSLPAGPDGEPQSHWDRRAADHPNTSVVQFQIWKGKGKAPWRWSAVTRAGDKLATSSDGYESPDACRRALAKLGIADLSSRCREVEATE